MPNSDYESDNSIFFVSSGISTSFSVLSFFSNKCIKSIVKFFVCIFSYRIVDFFWNDVINKILSNANDYLVKERDIKKIQSGIKGRLNILLKEKSDTIA